MYRRFTLVLRYCLLFLTLIGTIFQPQSSAYALTTLTVTPLTWNVIGLDSNDVNVGPNHFPVGARVCNSGSESATNVTAKFVWDTSDSFIDLRSGTLTSINLGTLNAGSCADAYFEVQVTRNASAYDHKRRYHIEVTAGNVTGTINTPTPRELYVEHLISQSRNAVTDVQLNGVSVAAGGTMNLMVGQTYTIKLVGFTATQGYEQIEYFINFPNTIFQILSVSSTFTADTSATVGPSPIDKLYGDNCVWDNDPNSPTYRMCLSTGKTGGDISTTYVVRILQVPGAPLVNPQPLSTLIYDFSGSSFHYNSDYGVSTRFANIVNASITKSFSPKTILPGGTSTLTFTINNPGSSAISNVNFTDDLPASTSLANSTVTYTGCGASPSPSTVSDPMSFSNITVAANGTCTVAVNVTSSTAGTYTNTTGNLFLGTTSTGSTASDVLIVSSQPPVPVSCSSPVTLASWTMPLSPAQGSGGPPPPYSTKASNVSSATASAVLTGAGSQSIVTTGVTTNAWGITDAWPSIAGAPGATAAPYFDFVVDTSNYGAVRITFDRDLEAPGDWGNATNSVYIYSSADGGAFSSATTIATSKGSWQTGATATAATTGASTTRFTIHADTRNDAKTTSTVYLDNIVISGCPRPTVPTLSKSFSPTSIGRGNASTLTFTFGNPNSSALSGISFSDTLPTGLVVNSPNGLSAISCSAGSVVTAPTISATAGASVISMSGLQLAANSTCSFSVSVKGNTAGSYTNVSESITATDSGPNTASTGYGTSSLTVVDSPVIAKSFSANPIFTGNTTSLDFDITNPNASTGLTGVTFTDVLPTGLSVANGTFSVCGGTNNLTTTAATRTITLLNTTTIAAGGTCSFSVIVTGSTAGTYTNTTGNVSSTNGGTGNTATANVLVKTPAPAINLLKQVGPTASGPWTSFLNRTVGSNVYYQFTVENTGDVSLSNVSVSDPTVSTTSCSWTRGDSATPVTSPFTLPVADAGNNQIATCVLGPITAVSGMHTNTATASGTSGSTVTKSSSAIYGTPAITLAKSVTETSFSAAGDLLHYSYLVTNSGGAPLLGPVTVADDKATVTCPAVSTVGDGDDWLDPADYPTAGTAAESLTCTATYIVTAGDVSNGSVTNTATASINGVSSNTASKTVYAPFDLTITKTNSATTVNTGSTTTYTIRATNNGPAAIAGAILSDLAVTGLSKTAVVCSATPGQCSSAPTIAALEGGAFALPSLASGQFYEITVTAIVTATSGSVTNTATIAAPAGSTESDTSNNSAADTDTVTPVADLIITKNDSVVSLNAGGTTTYTIRVTNNGPSSVTGAILSDPAATGLTKTAAACSATPGQCVTAPSIAQLEGGSFTLPALTSGQFYEITVSATVSASSGNVTNSAIVTPPSGTTNPGTSCVTSGGITRTFNAGTNACTSTDTNSVTSIIDLSLDKQASSTSPTVSSTVTFTLVVANGGPSAATNVVVTDVIPNGYTYVAASIAGGTSGNDADPAGSGLTWTINSLASGASANLTYQATVLGSGTYTNYAEITAHTETDSDSTPGNSSTTEDDDDTEVVTPVAIQPPSIAKQFSPNPVAINTVTSLTFSITNPNAGLALTGVAFTDSLPAGIQVASTPGASVISCGSPTFAPAAGNTSLSFSGGTIAAGGTCIVSVNVIGTAAGTKTNTTGTVTSTNGGTGNTATANLGVISATKTRIATSETSTSGGNVAIGEIVRYHLVLDLPEGTTTNLQLIDNIVTNMAYLNDGTTRIAFICNSGAACASSSTASIGSSPVISGNATTATPTFVLPSAAISNSDGGAISNPFPDGDDPMFSLGNVTNNDNDADSEYVVVEFNALVRNVAANVEGSKRGNTFIVRVNSAIITSTTSGTEQITIHEPSISAITKSVTTIPTDAGDTIVYQLQFQNTGVVPAFDITLTDTLNAVLTAPVIVSGSTTSGACGSVASTVSGSYSAPTVTATVTCLAANTTATVNITANVSNTALAGYTFSNAASLTYTSLPGTNGTASNPTGSTTPGAAGTGNGERNGSGGTDDYTASSNTVSTTLASPSLAKTINPAGTSYAIGTSIPYQITVTVPEGVTGGPLANIVETIPTGLVYVPGSLAVTTQAGVTIGAAGPYSDANASFFDLTGQTMTLSFGSFTSTASASATNRTVTISFNARVDNVIANQSGTIFNNSVNFNRTNPNGAGTLTLNGTNNSASVVEPDLNATKIASTTTPAFNSTLTYTLTIQHTGASNSAAYLLFIRDTLPAGLTGLTNVNISSSTPAGCATGVVNTSTASVLNVSINTLPLGCAVTITYDATVSGAVGSTQTNSVAVAWASTPNGSGTDRTGADGPGAGLNNYAVTTSTPVTVNPTIDAVDDDFSLSPIDGGSGGTTSSVISNDTTSGAAAVIGTNVTLTPGTAPTPATGSITMNADGTITVAPGTTEGTYTYPYTICTIPATTPATCDTATATVEVLEPIADVTTTVNVPATADAGSTVNGTVTFASNGPSTAANTTYTLILSPGLGTVSFPTLPGGVTASYNNITGAVTFTGMPTSLASGVSLTIDLSYTAPATGTVTVDSSISTTTSQGANAAPDSASGFTIITSIADVTTTVIVPATADAGSTVNGTVTYANNGPSTADGVTYGFTITPGLGTASFPTLPGGVTASYDNGTGVVTLTGMPGSLLSGQTLIIDLSYTAPSSGTVTVDTAIDTSTSQGANVAPDTATDSTTIIPIADVTTTVSVPASANAGSTVNGTVTFANNGPSTADGVSYTFSMTSGLGTVSFPTLPVGVVASYNNVTGTVSLTGMPTSLTSGETLTIDLSYTAPATGPVVVDTAISTTTSQGSNTAPDDASGFTTIVPIADVTTTVTVPASANAGSTVDGTITFANNGPSTAAGVAYTLTMTPGLGTVSFPTLPVGVTASYSNITGVVTLTGMPTSLNSGETLTIDLSYTAPGTGTVVVGTSISTTTDQGVNTAPDDDSDSTAITPIADVTTTVTVPGLASAGSSVNGTITFANNGPSVAANVSYSIFMTAGLGTLSFPTLPPGVNASYNNGTGVVTLTGMPTSLTSGETLTINLSYTAPGAGTVTLDTTIATSTFQGANAAPDTASGSTIITSIADVTTTVTVPATANAGATVNGTVTFANNGPSTAAGINYTFTMNAGLGTVSFPSLPGGVSASYDNASGIVTLTGMPAILTAGQILTIDLSYTAPATGPVTVDTAISTTTSQGSNTAPDAASGSTAITSIADVTTTVTVPATATSGSPVNGTVTFANNGPSAAANVTYTFTMTPGLGTVSFPTLPGAVTANYDNASGVVTLTGMPTSLNSAQTLSISLSYTAPATGPVTVDTAITTTTSQGANTAPDAASGSTTMNTAAIGIAKRIVGTTVVSPGAYDVTYELRVENFSATALNNIQVTENLGATFATPTTFAVQAVTSADFTVNAGYNGSSDTNLLNGAGSLAVGAHGTITLVVRVVPASAGPFNNTANASGQCPTCTTPVTDQSQNGSDPDPDSDGDPTNNNVATPLTFGPNLFDPPFGLKVVDPSGIPVLRWTMVWINDSNIVAINAQVSDSIPAGTSFIAGSLTCTPSGVTATNSCFYELPSATYPRGRVIWNGNLGPDLGATDAASAANEITITFDVNVAAGITSVQNSATIDYDGNGDGDLLDAGEQIVATASAVWNAASSSSSRSTTLPATGFAPNVITDLSSIPQQAYTATGDVTLEIPGLSVKLPVVGVPKKDGTWNVSWLGNQAGWLEGTAFPSWSGNSVLTSHVYLSNGLPGPFVNLGKLKYGDKIVIHAYGQKYTFEVRENKIVEPNDQSVMKHEEKSWLTLITCKEYDPLTNSYRKRVVVRAVLVNVTQE